MSDQPSILFDNNAAPYSPEAEEAVIGAVLINPNIFLTLAAFLQPDDFFLLRHQHIWMAFTRLNDRNEAIDYLTVVTELKNMNWLETIGGAPYLTRLLNSSPSAVNAEFYGRIVERTSVRRRLLRAADEIKALAVDEQIDIDRVITDAETRLFNVTDRQIRREFVPMNEAIGAYYDQIEYLMHNHEAGFGVPTGFRDLDTLLGGFQRSDLLIFAGRPGMGKCVAAGTLVPTERGLLPIEALKPKDVTGIPDEEGGVYYPLDLSVQTPYGARIATHFYDSGMKPTRTLRTRTGLTLTGTYAHPVLVISPEGERVWKTLGSLQAGDYVAVQREEALWGKPEALQDRVETVEDSGLRHCYDLTVPDGQTFITNGIVSHNTAFLLSAAANAARYGARVAIFTLEMGVDQLVQRLVAMETGINAQKFRTGDLTTQQFNRFAEAANRLSRLNIFIDDTPALSPIQMRTKCRRLQHEHGLDLVIVDYMQLMNAGGQYQNNRVQEISLISRSLKELARELNVPLLSAAQLSRAVEQRQDKRPVLSDLRESGCLCGDSPVYLPDEGRFVPIRDLCDTVGYRVLSLNTDTWKLEAAPVARAFHTGYKPVYRLTTRTGRTIRATANHKFLTINGWKRLDELQTADTIAVPRQLPTAEQQTMHSSERAARVANAVDSHELAVIAQSDVYWDTITAIVPDGETDVYDLTVPGNHNFVAENIIVHNSIEQDADVVMFLYRDVVYNKTTDYPNQADIIVAKHRNGKTDSVSLYYQEELTKFVDGAVRNVDLGDV